MGAPIYRVRKSFRGKAILQKLVSLPTYIGGKVDVYNRESKWIDVPYSGAAPFYVAQPKEKQNDQQ